MNLSTKLNTLKRQTEMFHNDTDTLWETLIALKKNTKVSPITERTTETLAEIISDLLNGTSLNQYLNFNLNSIYECCGINTKTLYPRRKEVFDNFIQSIKKFKTP